MGTGTNAYKLAFIEFRQETMYSSSIKTVRSKDSFQQEYWDNLFQTLNSFYVEFIIISKLYYLKW